MPAENDIHTRLATSPGLTLLAVLALDLLVPLRLPVLKRALS